ncbi:MAG: hypothetical protein ACI9J3_004062 [Parvicellaceae bacterium]|jgi:hypothetical protein
MKKILLPVIAASALLITACGEVTVTDLTDEITPTDVIVEPVVANYNVEASASTLEWQGTDATDDTHFHSGLIGIKSGSIETTDGMITGGSIVIDMSALTYTAGFSKGNAMDSESEAVANLWGHFSDTAFLNNITFPEATYTITGCDDTGVMGTLNVAGTDIELTIPGTPVVTEEGVSHTADFDVDLASAVPYLAGGGFGISMKLNLTAGK